MSRVALRRSAPRSASPGASAPGSWRTTTSTSPRRRQVVISSALEVPRSRPRPPAASRRSRTPGCRTAAASRCAYVGAPADRRRGTPRSRPPAATSRAARAAGPAAPPPSGPAPSSGGTTSPGAVPAGSITCAPSGTIACLRFDAADRLEVEVAASASSAAAGSSAIRASSASSSNSGRPAKPATTSIVRSSAVGPRPPLVTIRSTPCVGHEAQLGLHVLGAVAADRDVGELDAQLEQPVRQPRAVAVAHPAGQHLGAGDDDAGAGAHAQGRSPDRKLRCCPRGVNSQPAGSGPCSSGTGLAVGASAGPRSCPGSGAPACP